MSARRSAVVATVSLLSFLVVGSPSASARAAGEITVATCGSERAVTLQNAYPCGGADLLDPLFTGLTEWDSATSRSRYGVAQSITTKDNKRFTVRLRKSWKFHDGTEVKARNFVGAWNLVGGSRGANAFLFEDVKGYPSRKMSGLKVIDDHTFTIELNRPFGPFLKKLGHVAFSPLPDSALKSPASFTRMPIGNGPFRAVRWSPATDSVLERFTGYPGTTPQVSQVTFRSMDDDIQAYAALLSGDLDFLHSIPTSKLGRFKQDLNGRIIDRAGDWISGVSFPLKAGTNADLRKAVSLAVDRAKLAKRAMAGMRLAADALVPPTAEGARRGTCGVCAYNPSLARKYLSKARAKGYRATTLPLYYNSDAAYPDWAKAVAADVNKTFRGALKVVPVAKSSFDVFDRAARAGNLNGMFRSGWVLDFPHIQNVVEPMYASRGSYNYSIYRNKQVDAILAAADRQVSGTKAIRLYQKAESIVAKDLPFVPLWFYRVSAGYSSRIASAKLTPSGMLDLVSVKLA
jgi:oligopeptide transport system substrate-binding protein